MAEPDADDKAGADAGPLPRRIRSDHIAGAALLLLALGIAWEAHKLPLGSLYNPGPGYMPMLLAAVLGALAVVVALGGGSSRLLRALRWPELGHAGKILLACAFAALALPRLGYRLTVILLLVFLLGLVERQRPVTVALVALAFAFGTFYLFSDWLRVPLPRGPWNF